MTKAELIDKVAQDTRLSKAEAARVVASVLDSVTGSLAKGETVTLVGFGTFSVSRRAARQGRNPQTGETIEIRGNVVYVDGVALDEPYLADNVRTGRMDAVVVPEGQYFVMGDNRSRSQDSRVFGTVPIDTIVGKAFVIMWPADRWSWL